MQRPRLLNLLEPGKKFDMQGASLLNLLEFGKKFDTVSMVGALRLALLLLASVFCTALTGLQPIAIAAWLQPLFLLQFLHEVRVLDLEWIPMLVVLLCTLVAQALGGTFAFLGCFQGAETSASLVISEVSNLLIVLRFSMVLWVVMLVPFLVSLAYRRRFEKARLAQPLVFATLWTTAWYAWNRLGVMGALLDPAYTQYSVQPIVVTASLWGIEGINFLMSWFSALAHDRGVLLNTFKSQRCMELGKSLLRKLEKRGAMKQHGIQVKLFGGWLLFCLFYGSARVVLLSGNFYQKGILETMKPSVGASCLVAQDGNPQDLLNKTSQRIKAGDWIVVWSESAVEIHGKEAEDLLLAEAGKIARQGEETRRGEKGGGPYIGVTYDFLDEEMKTTFNTFSLVLPNGSIGFSYRKSHPVPFVETDVTAGELELPTVDTEYGRLGGAICFDFQFPDFIRQAGKKRVDIMVQPAETWGPTGPLLFGGDSFRAVENGFTWLRCSSVGLSGVATPFHEVVDYREAGSSSVLLMELPITKKVWTVYPVLGFIFGRLVALIALVHLLLACLPLSLVEAILLRVPSKLLLYFTGETSSEDFQQAWKQSGYMNYYSLLEG